MRIGADGAEPLSKGGAYNRAALPTKPEKDLVNSG